ncbi:MAG: dipeptide epimerase [Candidatus Omnitrophica bacterium]|nr:dipeptide epimerase [Candidatus Omnitrophota bacterium]
MIVEAYDICEVRAPLVSPFRIATGQHDELKNVFIRLRLANGVKGLGEAAVATHITGETVPQTLANLRRAAKVIQGKDIARYRAVCADIRPTFENNHAALAAFEMSILDAIMRSRGIPLWKLFGKRPKKFATDITVVIGSVDEARAQAKDFYSRGFRAFKIKIGRDEAADLARVKAVAQCAPRSNLILDANQGYDAVRMLAFLDALKKAGIKPALLEQPVPKGDWDGLARLTRESGVLVCADESVKSLADAKKAARLKAVNAINIKFMKSGILEAIAIAKFAQSRKMKLMIGAMMESALSITAAAHFSAGLGCFDFIDLDTTFFIKGPLSVSPYLDRRGRFDLAKAGPGIGVSVGLS